MKPAVVNNGNIVVACPTSGGSRICTFYHWAAMFTQFVAGSYVVHELWCVHI